MTMQTQRDRLIAYAEGIGSTTRDERRRIAAATLLRASRELGEIATAAAREQTSVLLEEVIRIRLAAVNVAAQALQCAIAPEQPQ